MQSRRPLSHSPAVASLPGGNGGGIGTDTGDGEGTDTSAFAIKVGDCINDADVSASVESVPVVDCAEPHDSEAYASDHHG